MTALEDLDWLDSETALLLSVRDRLRDALDLSPSECEIEFDELAHPITGQYYVVVTPAGNVPGDSHAPSGTVLHEVIAVDVVAMTRVADVSRDRRRELLAGESKFVRTNSVLNAMSHKIRSAIDTEWSKLMTECNQRIADSGDTRQGFEMPLRWISQDARPRTLPPEVFAATAGRQPAGMAKTIHFGGAERITVRINL